MNSKSHHLPSILKSIVNGEAIRIRRLNEKYYYHKNLNRLEEKNINSNFKEDMVSNVICIAKPRKTRFGSNKTTSKTNHDRIVSPLKYTNLVKLNQKEKALITSTSIIHFSVI